MWFRTVDRRFPFLWETASQPPGRWHGAGEGPVQYFASTPDGAWAELLRHEEIDDPADLLGLERSLWAVEIDETAETIRAPELAGRTLTGGLASYRRCRAEARRLHAGGATAVRAPSAGLRPGTARGQRVAGGLVEAADRNGEVLALLGRRPQARGWLCAAAGRPSARLLDFVRPLSR